MENSCVTTELSHVTDCLYTKSSSQSETHTDLECEASNLTCVLETFVMFFVMHVSFASPAPWYPGTSGDRAHTRSLEAHKFPTNIR